MTLRYYEWLASMRADAKARGAGTLRHLPGSDYERFRWSGTQAGGVNRGFTLPHDTRLASGEIVNPLTGEIVTGCLTVSRLANAMGVTSYNLTDIMVRLGFVVRVLDWKDIPMILAPELVKPQYFHTPEATRSAVEDGLIIPVKLREGGTVRELLLVTPGGQRRLAADVVEDHAPARRVDTRRTMISAMHRAGRSQADIVRMTDLPKQTVSRHLAAIKAAA